MTTAAFRNVVGPFTLGVVLSISTQVPAAPPGVGATNMSVVATDGDSRTWADGAGHQVVEIATGMNYFDGVSQQWVKSDPSFVAAPDGTTFFAQRMQHQVTLTANLNNVAALTARWRSRIYVNAHFSTCL